MSSNEDNVPDVTPEGIDAVEEWNMIDLSQSNSTGTSTPMTNSSCEFVKVSAHNADSDLEDNTISVVGLEDPVQDGQEVGATAATAVQSGVDIPAVDVPAVDVHGVDIPAVDVHGVDVHGVDVHGVDVHGVDVHGVDVHGVDVHGVDVHEVTESDSKDEELRHLMEILQERVKSGSPSHSISADSDFIHLHGSERECDDSMDVSTNSSAASRFNIIVQRDPNPYDHFDSEEEDERLGEDEVIPDADDRVESDIVVAQPLQILDDLEGDNEIVAARPVRHYRHSPNSPLNTLLTGVAITALGFAIGIAIGHSFGSTREAYLQQEIQEGQKLRLKAVQDDLLMCLRKQEDIDQTITKLNEIENILVDAEHWRNEYEELLNIKLKNEEKWRLEGADFKAALIEVEKSHDRLVQSKSCAHDSEFLSRQESTLKSVHEKLEGSLTDKDQLIERLQNEMADLKIKLRTAEQMLNGYKKANVDKSLLILSLKEQVLDLEREAFDMKINSEIDAQKDSNSSPLSDQQEDFGDVTEASVPEISRQSSHVEKAAEVADWADNSKDAEQVAAFNSCQSELLTLKTELGRKQEETTPQSADHINITSATQQYEQKIASLQLKLKVLQTKISGFEHDRLNETGRIFDNQTNSTILPCVVFNFCDQLRVNITTAQIIKLYEATKGQYDSLQAFILSEWKLIVDDLLLRQRSEEPQPHSTEGKIHWKGYMHKTKSTVTDFLASMNDTWQDLSETIGPSKKLQKKFNKNVEHMASVLGSLMNRLRRQSQDPESGGTSEDSHASQPADTASDVEQSTPDKRLNKFEKRLHALKDLLYNLDAWRVDKMKRYEKKDIFERFDDFNDDYSYMFSNPDLAEIRSWVECQSLWWKQQIKHTSTDEDFETKCSGELVSWQRNPDLLNEDAEDAGVVADAADEVEYNEVDGTWQYKRAEMRKYHRDEPDDWYWRRSHDYEDEDTEANVVHFPQDEL